jgi:hypothetical protein
VLPARSTRCPYCHAPQPPVAEGTPVACAYCGSHFVVSGGMCPRCGTLNAPDAETCRECGEPLTTLGRVFQRHRDARKPPQFLEFARSQAPSIKRSEAEAWRRRSDAFDAEEAHRLDTLRSRRQQQAAKDKQLLFIGLASLGVVALLVISILAVQLILR